MDLGRGFNGSILFMLSVIGLIFGGFVFLIRSSYRSDRRRAETGENYRPEGKLRWDD